MNAQDFNKQTIEEFRANKGVVGGMFAGSSLLLLHHVGAKSGTERVAPLGYQAEADAWVIIANNNGAPANPDWYHNLLANPATTVELGTETLSVVARVAQGSERTRLWDAAKARMPMYAESEDKIDREIPVIVLERSR